MSDAKAIKISKLIDYHREIENLRLSGELPADLSTEIELMRDQHIKHGTQSATKAEQQFLRRFENIDNDKHLIDLQSRINIPS